MCWKSRCGVENTERWLFRRSRRGVASGFNREVVAGDFFPFFFFLPQSQWKWENKVTGLEQEAGV